MDTADKQPTPVAPPESTPVAAAAPAQTGPLKKSPWKALRWAGLVVGLLLTAWFVFPWIVLAMNTVSTDDAYVDGHVTFVAARVAGQVKEVLVDDNVHVKKGDVLVIIDPEPFQVQVDIQKAMVAVAEADLAAAYATVEGDIAQARSARFNLEHAIETVRNQVALLRSNVAQLKVTQSNLVLAERDYERNKKLVEEQAVTQAEFDIYSARLDAARSQVDSAQQVIQETRASLGLQANEQDPLSIPDDLEQNFSLVREALAQALEAVARVGYTPKSWNLTPQQALDAFYKQDPDGNLDRIYARLLPNAPLVKQSEAKLMQAKRDLELAELNLRYTKVVSEIDGVVTRRNVNPGNNVQVGQSLMAVRSLTEIWVNANFKETQLANLRIGQPVRMRVDMYGRKQEFNGRISGFTMGTGQTLALLPPQNATGNFIKIVQRLPVRIEFTDYDPAKAPLFVGLSVTPYVYFKEPAAGPNAGDVLQPPAILPAPAGDPESRAEEAAGFEKPSPPPVEKMP